MKAEEQILELLTEVLRKQDHMQGQIGQMQEQVGHLQGQVGQIVQTLQGHQQALRTLAAEQQRQGQQLNDLQEAVESMARMQRN